jgi:hypothetical protein
LGSLTSFSSVFQWQLLSQLLPQWGMACLHVLEISSVGHPLSCFRVVFLLCWVTVGVDLFLCLALTSLWQGQWSVSRPPDVSVLWWFADCFLILHCQLTLDVAHWLWRWALWTTTCSILGSCLSPARCWPFCLSSYLFTESSHGDQLLPPLPLSGVFTALHPLCC